MKKKFALLALSFNMMLGTKVFAKTDLIVKVNPTLEIISVTGNASPNEKLGFGLIYGTDFYNVWEDSVIWNKTVLKNQDGTKITLSDASGSAAYIGETTTDENGKIDFNIGMTEKGSGDYLLILSPKNSDKIEIRVPFTDKYTYAEYVRGLNSKINDKISFLSYLSDNKTIFGFDNKNYQNVTESSVFDMIYEEMKSTDGFCETDYTENEKVYNTAAIINLLNEGKISNASIDLQKIYENSNNALSKDIKAFASKVDNDRYFTLNLSNKSITGFLDLEKKTKAAILLTIAKYPDGYGSLKTAFSNYKDVLGLDAVSQNDSIYKAMVANGEYSDIVALLGEYNRLLNKPEDKTGGNSATGSAGKNTTKQSSIGNISSSSVGSNISPVIELKFEDLNSVQWAYTAISKLFYEGIVNGASETEFIPDKTVKREEFISMLVRTMGIDAKFESEIFSDVVDEAWYAKAVNTAYTCGLVNGKGNGIFGIGESITRQDMAVMLYNAIKYKGFKPCGESLKFSDKTDISEYAKEAVAELNAVKIVNGVDEYNFAPQNNATRAEAAVIIYNAIEFLQ